jgi:hypothetical protein
MLRTLRRLLACSILAVLCVVASGATTASAAPAQMERALWEEISRISWYPPNCMTRNIDLAAGNYLWEGFERLVDENHTGFDRGVERVQKIIYLRAGTYRWSTCLGYDDLNHWTHSNSLTELATGGVARMHQSRIGETSVPMYDYIEGFGANLWRCSTEPVC